jgi:RNA polymerase sigma-70 factor (ECF subfamily)
MPEPPDDATLVAQAKRGNSAALAEIYERHHGAVFRYVFYRVGDEATAEDLTATVFVRVVESIDRYVHRGRPLLAWLYTIARNAVIDHHRKAGPPDALPLDERLLEADDDVDEELDKALTRRRLTVALSHLTEDQRQVIVLKFVEGLSNEDVATMLGKTVGAVKALQHRALAALHRLLVADRSL